MLCDCERRVVLLGVEEGGSLFDVEVEQLMY
jgi:hypothetical protein